MNRSAINAELEYYLRVQERDRMQGGEALRGLGKVRRDVKEGPIHFLAIVAERRRQRAERRQRARERLLAEAAAVLQREPEAKEKGWLERLALHRRR